MEPTVDIIDAVRDGAQHATVPETKKVDIIKDATLEAALNSAFSQIRIAVEVRLTELEKCARDIAKTHPDAVISDRKGDICLTDMLAAIAIRIEKGTMDISKAPQALRIFEQRINQNSVE